MNHKGLIQYFIDGFTLVNKAIVLFIPLAILALVFSLTEEANRSQENSALIVFSLVTLFAYAAYSFSLPLFFQDVQQGKKVTFGRLFTVSTKNGRRLLIPFVVLFGLFILAIVLIGVGIVALIDAGTIQKEFLENPISFENIAKPFNLFLLIMTVLFSPLIFMAIFFSIENNGFLLSFKKSAVFAFRNLGFLAVFIALSFVFNSLAYYIPQKPFYYLLLNQLLFYYISLWLTAASLLYYQARTHE